MKYDFGNRLQLLLNENNISQRELSKMVGTTEATISRYINNIQKPRPDILANIATTLNTTTDYLLGRDEYSILNKQNNSYSRLIFLIKEAQGNKSLNQFALTCNVNAGHLSRLLSGNFVNPPSPETLKKIANSNNKVSYVELLIASGYLEEKDIKIYMNK